MVKWTVRTKVVPSSKPKDEKIDVFHVHNLKADGVRGVRKQLKVLRLGLTELEFMYCKITEEQWALLFNALSGVRTNLLSAERAAADQFLADLKREFGDVGEQKATPEELEEKAAAEIRKVSSRI